MTKKFRIHVTGGGGGEENVGKTVFPINGWKRTSHSFKSITQVHSARKGQSKYLHSIVVHDEKLNRMLGEKKERTRVLLKALGTTPGLLATCLSFTSLFILSVTPASSCYIIWSFPESHSIRQEKTRAPNRHNCECPFKERNHHSNG